MPQPHHEKPRADSASGAFCKFPATPSQVFFFILTLEEALSQSTSILSRSRSYGRELRMICLQVISIFSVTRAKNMVNEHNTLHPRSISPTSSTVCLSTQTLFPPAIIYYTVSTLYVRAVQQSLINRKKGVVARLKRFSASFSCSCEVRPTTRLGHQGEASYHL
jgi:hypothetical protein